MEKILTVNDVANVLQVKAITVREMFREKRLRGFKVGKSWRTTEIMLQEDINALARGESPAELPSPTAPNPSAAPQIPTAASVPVSSPAPAPKAAPAAASPPKAVPVTPKAAAAAETPPPVRAPKKPAAKDSEPEADDTQQLLF